MKYIIAKEKGMIEITFKPIIYTIILVYEDEPDEEGILRIKGWYCKEIKDEDNKNTSY